MLFWAYGEITHLLYSQYMEASPATVGYGGQGFRKGMPGCR